MKKSSTKKIPNNFSRTVIGKIYELSKSQSSTFFVPTLWLKAQLSFQHLNELSNLRALLLLALHRRVARKKVPVHRVLTELHDVPLKLHHVVAPREIPRRLIPALRLKAQLSFQQNPNLTELESSQMFPTTPLICMDSLTVQYCSKQKNSTVGVPPPL